MLHELLLMAENHPVHSLLWYPCRQYDCHQRNPQGSIMKQWNQSSSKSHFQWKSTYPTQALDADVISFSSTRGAIGNPVLQLIEVSGSSNPTIEFTAIFYGNCRKKKKSNFWWTIKQLNIPMSQNKIHIKNILRTHSRCTLEAISR